MNFFVHITCYKCKLTFGMPDDFYNTMKQLAESGRFHCPAGHLQCFTSGETEADTLRRERDKLKQDIAYWQDRRQEEQQAREAAERSLRATRGQVTKIKNRVSNGVCPCCNRTFSNLHNHMKSKHPEFKKEEAA